MIWEPQEVSAADASALQSHLTARAVALCGESVVSPEHLREAARAVAEYWLRELGRRCVTDDCLAVLLSRSLAGAGEREAAEKLLSEHGGAPMAQRAAFLIRSRWGAAWAWKACATRLVRTSRWSTLTVRDIWVLDLNALAWPEEAALELALLGALRGLIRCLADVWDDTSGEGGLGLRGLAQRCAAVLGCGSRDSRARMLACEMRRHVAHGLQSEARQRGWTACPSVLDLDL